MNNITPSATKRSAKPSMIFGTIDNPAFEYKDRTEDVVGSTIYLREGRSGPIGLNVTAYSEDLSLTSLGRVTSLTKVPRTPSSIRYGDDKYSSYRRTFWNKVSASARLDVAVADTYMRSRSAFALASATSLLGDLPLSVANSTIKYIADNITEEQARRHVRNIRSGRVTGTCEDDIRANCSPSHTVVHCATMGHWFANMDKELKWRSVHDFAKQVENSMRTFQEAVTTVVPQSGGDNWWLKAITKPLKGVGAAIRRFAQFGIAGRIIVYTAVTMILGVVMKRVPWWAVVAVLTCAELGWIREISQDIADILPRDPEEEFQFDNGRSTQAADMYFDTFEAPSWFCDRIDEEDCCDVEPQSGAATTVLAACVTAIIARRVPLYTKIVNGPKFRAGLEDILQGVEGAFESTVNLVLRAFGSKRVFKIKREQTAINKFCDGVDKLDVEVRARGCEIDDTMFQKFAGFIAFGEETLTQWPRDSDEWRKVKKAMGVLTKLSCDYPAHFNSAKARIEPIGLMLAGDPGLGKTTLLKAITKIIARYEFPDEPYDMSRHMFQKPVGPYYEGYKGQTVFCVDDIFTKKPVAGETDGDAETVVKLINQWPLALNMANCALKGRFYMTSPYVIATTNMTRIDDLSKTVTTAEAIVRRFPLWYEVHRRPGVEITPGCNPDEVWTFTKANFRDTGNTAQHITFTELMHMLFEERRRRIRFAAQDAIGDEYMDELFDGLESCRAVDGLRRPVVAQAGGSGLLRRVITRTATAVAAVGALVKVAGSLGKCAVRRVRAFVRKEAPIIMNKLIGLTVKMAARATALALALYIAYKGVRAMITSSFNLFGKARKPEHSVVPQSAVRDEVVELVQRNMFTVQCGNHALGFALGLDDMTMVMPAHFLENSERQRAPLIAKGRRANYIELDRPSHVDQKRDLAYFRVKTMCKDITKSHVAPEPKERELLLVKPSTVVACSTTLQPKSVRYSGACGRAPVDRMLHVHTARTRYGDCGAIIMAGTGKGGRRIYGMHTACDLNAAYYAGCYTTFGTTVVAQSSDDFCGHRLVRKIEKPIHNGGDTRLEPTPYAGCNGAVKTLPSLKRPVDGVDPMIKAIEGYKRDWCVVPPEMGSCVKAVVSEIFEAIKGHDLGPTSVWEAAAGIAGEPYCKGLARGKSPGYPFIEKYHDKKQMLGSEGPYIQGPAYGELVASVEELRAKYKRGEQGAVYRDSLKDEPRKLEKIRNCQTRMISGCPVELAVLGRTQTLRFTSALMVTRHEHGIMPGFNPYGVEANQLYHRLAFVNSKRTATAGDYKEFDKTQHPKIMGDIWSEISRRLVVHGCDADVLRGLGMDTFNAMHLGGNSYVSDTIYQVDGTLPSGHWMTSFLNSIYNAVVLRYCWVKHKGSLAYVYDFCRHVAAVYYGDDFVMAVDDEHTTFGLDTLQKYVKDLGMIMTDEDGNHGGASNKDLLDISFLCRKFRIDDDGLVWMPLETDSIDDMYNWKKKSTPISTHTEAIVRASLMEAAAHDMQTFVRYYRLAQEIAPKYVDRFAEMSLPLEAAYDHWRLVHKGYVPIWSDDDDTPC